MLSRHNTMSYITSMKTWRCELLIMAMLIFLPLAVWCCLVLISISQSGKHSLEDIGDGGDVYKRFQIIN
ncbi:hypothetical protein QE152_g33267 [Popillia japonica]|uniref:Uncharacterized protein n=1 Tax=Popillia japonica TaxID=7064 RepID=A0AAW1IXB1_POPJA